ncbi:MAG: hypothetical protein BGO49_16995 [Planctomycetales bacterium 71-10]|nr:MAG: hypothetical protein BGO49_16995 [Planctomycetales bacterium 71-10]
MTAITLATEDELSEAVGRRLLLDSGVAIGQLLRRRGFGYLRSRMPNFCEMASRVPVVVLTDLDAAACPSSLIRDWLDGRPQPDGLILRVAVREIEAWLLADHEGLSALFNRTKSLKAPHQPDDVADPKRELLRLAEKHAPKDVRLDLVPGKGTEARQGLGYNDRLCPWVRDVWDPGAARRRSPSLDRAMVRLEALAASLRA